MATSLYLSINITTYFFICNKALVRAKEPAIPSVSQGGSKFTRHWKPVSIATFYALIKADAANLKQSGLS